MRFSYVPRATLHPIATLGGTSLRYRPVIPFQLFGPLRSGVWDGLVDSGSDDTVFPESYARKVGINLASAPHAGARSVGGAQIPYLLSTVTLRVTDGSETWEWSAVVGFINVAMPWAILGHAGFLQFFDVELRGARREILLTPNNTFPGRKLP